VTPEAVRVHYIGLDDRWDENINLSRDADRIRPGGTMTALMHVKSPGEAGPGITPNSQRRLSSSKALGMNSSFAGDKSFTVRSSFFSIGERSSFIGADLRASFIGDGDFARNNSNY
jgi:hypothetical protein